MEHQPIYNEPKVGEKIADILHEQMPVAEIVDVGENLV